MSDAVSRVSVEIGSTEIVFETGKLARQASGAVTVQAGDTKVLSTATAGNQRDVDFLPLTVDVEERMYAAGKIPGSFFRREGRAGEKATLTARMIDRPLRPLFPKGWNARDAAGLDPDVDRPRALLRRARHERRQRGAPDLGHPVPRARRRGAHRPGRRGQLHRQPRRGVAAREPARPDRRRHRGRHPDGRGRRRRDHRGGDPRCARHRPQRDQEALRGAARPAEAGRQGEDRPSRARRWTRACSPRCSERFGPALDEATQVVDKLDRQDATKRVEEEAIEASPATPRRTTTRSGAPPAQQAFDKLEKDIIRKRIAVDKKRPDGRAAEEIREISIEVGGGPAHRTGPRSSPAARRRRSRWPPSAPRATRCASTRSASRRPSATSTTTTSRRSRSGEAGFMRGPKRRDIGHGALAERALVPVIPTREEFPYTDPRGVGHPRVERLVVDGLRLRLDAGPDGRRREDQAPGGGNRHGPDQGGRRLHRPHRHRRRRGPPRRHGLQGGRHRRGHHRPPDGHQDHGRHVRHPARTRSRRPEGPHLDPRRDGARRIAEPREELSQYAPRISADPDRRPTRSAPSSARAGRRSARCRRSSTRRSTSTTTAPCASTPPPATRATPWLTASGR